MTSIASHCERRRGRCMSQATRNNNATAELSSEKKFSPKVQVIEHLMASPSFLVEYLFVMYRLSRGSTLVLVKYNSWLNLLEWFNWEWDYLACKIDTVRVVLVLHKCLLLFSQGTTYALLLLVQYSRYEYRTEKRRKRKKNSILYFEMITGTPKQCPIDVSQAASNIAKGRPEVHYDHILYCTNRRFRAGRRRERNGVEMNKKNAQRLVVS